MNYNLAQSNALGNESAQLLLRNTLRLSENTAESWQRIWDVAVNPAEPLWQAIVYLGAFIFFIYLFIYLVQTYARGVFERDAALRLLFSGLLFFGNGYFLANLGKLLHAISQYWTSLTINYTLAGVKISDAIGSIQNTGIARSRTSEIFAECVSKSGTALDECVGDPVKIQQATELLQQLQGNNAPLQGSLLEQITNGITSGLNAINSLPYLVAIQVLSGILQWVAVNLFQMAAILGIMLSPIFVGLAALPNGGQSLLGWFSDYIKLLLFPIAYALISGFMANVLTLTEQQGQPLGSTILDVAYLVFISTAAPLLAWVGVQHGTTGIFNTLGGSAKNVAEAGASAASGGSNLLVKAKAIEKFQG